MSSFEIIEGSFGAQKASYLFGSFSLKDSDKGTRTYLIKEAVKKIEKISEIGGMVTFKVQLDGDSFFIAHATKQIFNIFSIYACDKAAPQEGWKPNSKRKEKKEGVPFFLGLIIIVGLCYLIAAGDSLKSKPSTVREHQKLATVPPAQQTPAISAKDQYMELIRIERDFIKHYNISTQITDATSIMAAAYLMSGWATTYEKRKGYALTDTEAAEVAEYKMEVVNLQVRALPRMRDLYGPESRRLAWQYDVDVRTIGEGYRTIEYVGAMFAANRNIQTFMDTVRPALMPLRFKQSRFKWYKGADEATFYNLPVPSDRELVIWQEYDYRSAE